MGMLSVNKRPKVVCGESRTQQHLSDLCSPKRLIEKYGAKRLNAALRLQPQIFAAMPEANDLKEAMDTVMRGEESFKTLPSGLRKRFDNDPVELAKFLDDPKNRDEAVKLGLVKPPEAPPAPKEPKGVEVPAGKDK